MIKYVFLFLLSCAQSNYFFVKNTNMYVFNKKKYPLNRVSWYSNLSLIEDIYYTSLQPEFNIHFKDPFIQSCPEKLLIFNYSMNFSSGKPSLFEEHLRSNSIKYSKEESSLSFIKNTPSYNNFHLFQYSPVVICKNNKLKLSFPNFRDVFLDKD